MLFYWSGGHWSPVFGVETVQKAAVEGGHGIPAMVRLLSHVDGGVREAGLLGSWAAWSAELWAHKSGTANRQGSARNCFKEAARDPVS